MAFPNLSDMISTTIANRSGSVADNVTKNNALLTRLSTKGRMKKFSGGESMIEELSFAENSNAGSYADYDILPVGASDVISSATFDIKQLACPVTISGTEMLKNAGKERIINLLEARIEVAENTMKNLVCTQLYGDGTGNAGKDIDGLDVAVPEDPTSGTYGGIDRATWNFWRSQASSPTGVTPANITKAMNAMWVSLVRGTDAPDLIMCDNSFYIAYLESLQANMRFTSPGMAEAGFTSIKYMNADVVLDGAIGGACPAGTAFFLNSDYIKYRPHSARNFVSIGKRMSTNQDAEVDILAWAGNLTMSGSQFQGRINATITP